MSEMKQTGQGPQLVVPVADALFLWKLLDDIDTASDIAKDNDKAYRAIVEGIQRKRFQVGSTDGFTVTFPNAWDARQGGRDD